MNKNFIGFFVSYITCTWRCQKCPIFCGLNFYFWIFSHNFFTILWLNSGRFYSINFQCVLQKLHPKWSSKVRYLIFARCQNSLFVCRGFFKRPTYTHPQTLWLLWLLFRYQCWSRECCKIFWCNFFIGKLKFMGCSGPNFCCQGQSRNFALCWNRVPNFRLPLQIKFL